MPTAPDSLPTAITSRARVRRATSRVSSAYHSASFRPKVIGSACTPCVRPIIGVRRCSSARVCTACISASRSLEDQVARLAHLQGLRGVDDVGRRHAEVQPARRGADVLGHGGREGDDVVLGDLFDFLDARDVEARRARGCRAPHRPARCRPAPWLRLRPLQPAARSRTSAGRSRCDPFQGAYTAGSSIAEITLR